MWTIGFWKQAGERAVKTAAQTLILMWVGDGMFNVLTVDWKLAAGAAGGGAVLSVLTSMASANMGEKGTPDLVK
jgi:hypothetical protein